MTQTLNDNHIYLDGGLRIYLITVGITERSIVKIMKKRDYRTRTISSSDSSKFPHIDNEGCLV